MNPPLKPDNRNVIMEVQTLCMKGSLHLGHDCDRRSSNIPTWKEHCGIKGVVKDQAERVTRQIDAAGNGTA
eukprot:8939587-Prorocentrum_lima.AAC.1